MWVKLKALSFILSQLLISIGLVEAISKCYDTAKFTTNSTYGRNRDLILASLPTNVSTNGNFFNTSIGENSDKVYALGMCRGDATPENCYRCLNSTIHSLNASCPNQKEALSYEKDPCHVHYADHLFSGNLEPGDPELVVDAKKITFDITKFETIWASLIDGVVSKASKGTSKLKYATGEVVLSVNERMYLLMQCTPDLSRTACSSCLWQTGNYYENCCRGYQGGSVMKHNCYFRWQLYPFYLYNASYSATPRLPAPSPPPPSVNTNSTKDVQKHNKSNWIPLGASLSVTLGVVLFSACGIFLWKKRNIQRDKKDSQEVQLLDIVNERVTHANTSANFHLENAGGSQEFPSIQLDILQAATDDFSDENKLGQGGFGPVYKGTLADGNDIAVKRLSKTSGQGQLEFKNEVMLIAKLQHRNLVRLIGCCLENNETLLVYEFMPNRSLDVFIFDSSLGKQLAWPKRFSIIKGTSRGMMYLHEDSRLRIIHRDLKASNVLLDLEMNPKISDFGMAKVFGVDQNEANTNRVVGTYGYMAPEYAMEGLFSVKSDVFSFGVLLLEIISGKKNNGFHLSERGESLLTFAWKLWWRGEGMKLIDVNLVESSSPIEVLKCINIGLLCVQADPADRPTMSSVVAMLENDTIMLPLPGKPAFYVGRFVLEPKQTNSIDKICSVNGVTISNMSPR